MFPKVESRLLGWEQVLSQQKRNAVRKTEFFIADGLLKSKTVSTNWNNGHTNNRGSIIKI